MNQGARPAGATHGAPAAGSPHASSAATPAATTAASAGAFGTGGLSHTGQALMQGTAGAVWALTVSGVQGLLKSKLLWVAVAFSAVHIGARLVAVVLFQNLAPLGATELLNSAFLSGAVALQALVPMVIVLSAVGTRVTSRDRMNGGLEFILSKGIPRWGYVAARALLPVLAAALVVLVPTMFLAGLIAASVPLSAGTTDLLWGLLAQAAVVTLAMGPLAAGLGALTDNPRSAAALWLAVAWATVPLAGLLFELGADWFWVVSPLNVALLVGGTFVGEAFPGDLGQGWLVLLFLVVAPLALLWHRAGEVYT